MLFLRVLVAPVVVACMAASAVFAFEFGWARGATEVHQWTYGGAGVALDLLKASLPIFAATAFAERQWGRSLGCWVAFFWLTVMSLMCAYGTTAGQLAERISNQVVAATTQSSRQGTLDRLQKERGDVPAFQAMTAEGLEAYQARAASAEQQRKAECEERGKPGPLCRDREADKRGADAALAKAVADKASSDQAAQLDEQIAAAEAAVRTVDVKTAAKEADPQSASMAKAFGLDQNLIATVSHSILAIAIEIGSGFGPWLVFGHGVGRRRKEEHGSTPTAAMDTDAEFRLRFFQECITATSGKRVSASEVHGAYRDWCERQGRKAMASRAFGKDTPWPKEKVGGNVYYLNCVLGVRARPSLQVVANNSAGRRRLQPA